MTIAAIHILEALVVFLLGLKLFTIRSLYKKSLELPQKSVSERTQLKSHQRLSTRHKLGALDIKSDSNQFLKTLPVPEVLFSPEHEEVVMTDVPSQPEKKCELSSYIDDFFFEPSPINSFEPTTGPDFVSTLQASNDEVMQAEEDEFITVQEENAEMVRALEALKREIAVPARG